MNWLRALLGVQGAKASGAESGTVSASSGRPLPADKRITCYCGEDHPLELIKALNDFAYSVPAISSEPGETVEAFEHRLKQLPAPRCVNEVTGAIVHCLACDEVFAFGPKGKFWRKRRPQQPAEGLAPNANVVPRPPADRGGLPRVPREAPTV